MNNRAIPAKGEIWVEFTDAEREYQILGISFAAINSENEIRYWAVSQWGLDAETQKPIAVHQLWEGIVLHDGVQQLPNYVVYQECNTSKIYVTPLDRFLEILGNGTTHYYRFTKQG